MGNQEYINLAKPHALCDAHCEIIVLKVSKFIYLEVMVILYTK